MDLQGFTWWVPVICGFMGLAVVLTWDLYKGNQPLIQQDEMVVKERQKEWENLKFEVIKNLSGIFLMFVGIVAFFGAILVVIFLGKLIGNY